MMRKSTTIAALVALVAALSAVSLFADTQGFRHAGVDFNVVRTVSVPAGKNYSVVVVEFYHHGEIQPGGENVVVVTKSKTLVPRKILQLGPGDFCRLAFETVKGESEYEIFYGGDAPSEPLPVWKCRDGLLLETREFKRCDMEQLASVRNAFTSAKAIGADYVEGVFNSFNPTTLKREPFMSHYSGVLDVPTADTYGFYVSSEDCSFLLIDGKEIASAPGKHKPVYSAAARYRNDIPLTEGRHSFDFYHAASGTATMAIVAWIVKPDDTNFAKKPTKIPLEYFNAQRVAHLPVGNATLRSNKLEPDFSYKIIGEQPLPDNDTPLIAVAFHSELTRQLALPGTLYHWDFGDGQTSRLQNCDHVFLHPGLYTVKFAVRSAGKTLKTTSQIYVDRPNANPTGKEPKLDDFLKMIEEYDMKKLDVQSIHQVVSAFELKAQNLNISSEAAAEQARIAEEEAPTRTSPKRKPATHAKANAAASSDPESMRYLKRAVTIAAAAFVDDSAEGSDADVLELAKEVGPIVHFKLDNSKSAFKMWEGAAKRMKPGAARAGCEVAAADIAINDLLDLQLAKKLLAAATKEIGSHEIDANFHRVSGDYYAAVGNGKEAQKEYLEAEKDVASKRKLVEKAAWRGAHARSTEQYLRDKHFPAAIEELWNWQHEFPAEKIDGYWFLLFAEYWAARGQFDQAVAQAERLQAVNPDSNYADQILYLAAACEVKRGKTDRAIATLHSILKDYPGSPMVPQVQKRLAELEKK